MSTHLTFFITILADEANVTYKDDDKNSMQLLEDERTNSHNELLLSDCDQNQNDRNDEQQCKETGKR